MVQLLGIEIGGTKLQLGVGSGNGTLETLVRLDVQPELGARGIRDAISKAAAELIPNYNVTRIGIGFGGPIDRTQGRVTTSHQIQGWDNFPIVSWCQDTCGLPTALGNDCDVAALAEATQGAGRDCRRVLYVTVGTGVGGGLVIDQEIYGVDRPAASEIGHLRVGMETGNLTVEQMASGRGLCDRLWHNLSRTDSHAADLLDRCQDRRENLTGQIVSEAAHQGNPLAQRAIAEACRALGWAIGQVITIAAPEIVVIGGGISLMGPEQFFAPVRHSAAQSVFGPLAESYRIVPAQLGELAVVHGALALAAEADRA